MRGAHTSPGISVEIFVEQHVIFKMRISRQFGMIFQDGSLAIITFKK